jgi:hypothetical protein
MYIQEVISKLREDFWDRLMQYFNVVVMRSKLKPVESYGRL